MKSSAKWILGFTGVSLSLNLFFAGYLAGGHFTNSAEIAGLKSQMQEQIQDQNKDMGAFKRNRHGRKGDRMRERMRGGPAGVPFSVKRLVSALPEEKRAEIKPILESHRDQVIDAIRGHKGKQADLHKLITAEKLDIEAINKALSDNMAFKAKIEGVTQKIMLEVLEKLTVEERREFARKMMRDRFRGRMKERFKERMKERDFKRKDISSDN